jgi:hypothetical protein
MMSEAEHSSVELANDIQVRRFRRERHGCSRKRGAAVESSASKASAGQEVSNGFQS